MYFLIFIGIVGIVILLKKIIQKAIVKIICVFAEIHEEKFEHLVFPSLIRVIVLNWYNYLVILLIWLLLFFTEVGKDIIDSYLSNLKDFNTLSSVIGTCLSLFFCILIMSISIWILPFFIYSPAKQLDILGNADRFYLSTKILAFIAMFPFILIVNAFLFFSLNGALQLWLLLAINIGALFIFFGSNYIFTRKLHSIKILKQLIPFFSNAYLAILFRIIISIVAITLLFALAKISVLKHASLNTLSYSMAIYIFLCGAVVFSLLFYSNEKNKEIKTIVEDMLSDLNKKNSKRLYVTLSALLTCIVFYYYFVPSLEATNPLFILLIVFSFYIIYFDFWKHIFSYRNGILKVVAFFAILLFLVMPLITPGGQFYIPLNNLSQNDTTVTLESALKMRLNHIVQREPDTGDVYIVCAMGGGSRAGYITALTLKTIDSVEPEFWNHTVCYSTVSGGSVGLFNYVIARETGRLKTDSNFLKNIYQKNYNSSGVYGLLIGDKLETLFGSPLISLRGLIVHDSAEYYDRNYRIRKEYDYILANELSNNKLDYTYGNTTFYPLKRDFKTVEIPFKKFYNDHNGDIPIHLINSFEVNSGRRTVISPFATTNKNFFSNSIMPLQDTTFDSNILKKDIFYRDASNLSELFPLFSAASRIGKKRRLQFVDGGYYENYGLATALDVFYYLKDSCSVSTKRLKIILIKNSRQEPEADGNTPQLFAPLVGVMEAPFTGHANNLEFEAIRSLANGNFYRKVFDAEKKDVPLTRSLTKRHIDSMNTFKSELLSSGLHF